MSETYEVYAEMIDTLRQARGAVHQELEALTRAPGRDRPDLARVREAVTSFDGQAQALVLTMSDRAVPDDLLWMAEELAHFFQDARRQVDILSGPDQS